MSEGAPVLGPIGGPLVEHALAYGQAGLHVFPVNPRDKTPLCSQHLASTARNLIGDWWERWPDALIGHRLPKGSVVTDIDPRHHGDATWKALRDEIGELPLTRVHASGRGDGGGHFWWQRPEGKLNIRGLNDWAREHSVGEAHGTRWASGIDLLHHDHRYTILPPSPHPETGKPYVWVDGRGLQVQPAPMPDLLAELLIEPERVEPVALPRPADPDSIADWFSATSSWASVLEPHGWSRVGGDGEHDGSAWRHPLATSPVSATIKHGCLFVYSPNTPFEPTEAGDAHGYTRFAAWALLEHRGDLSAAARAARERHGGPVKPAVDLDRLVTTSRLSAVPQAEVAPDDHLDPDLDEFLATDDEDYDWLVPGLLERGDRTIITGPEGGGKSTLLRQLAIQLASGLHPFTLEPITPMQVLYVDCENSPRQARRALRGLREAAGESYIEGRLRLRVLGHSIELAKADVMADLGARIEAQGVDVLVIGPLYKLLDDDPVKELPAKAVADAIDWLRGLRQSAVLIEAHSPYADGGGKTRPVRPYGASLWSRWPEFGMHLDGGPNCKPEQDGKITHWRGQRDERTWPSQLERSEPWPWAPKYGATSEPEPWDGPTQCADAVVAFLAENEGDFSLSQLGKRLRERGLSYRDATIASAVRLAESHGRLATKKGPRSALLCSKPDPGLGVLPIEEEF